MNVLHVVESLKNEAGGPAYSVPRLGEAVHTPDVHVELFVHNPEGNNCSEKETNSTFLPIKPVRQLQETVQLLRGKKSENPIIHNHGIWLPLNHEACKVARRSKVPLVISPRGMLEPWARNHRRFKKALAWNLYQRRDLQAASVLHATSKQEAANLADLGINLPIAVIPNGVDVPVPDDSRLDSGKKKRLLFLSRIHPKKGLIDLVRAWAEIRADDWQLVIAGPDEDEHRAEVEREIERLGLTESFCFTGPVTGDGKWKLYRSCALFVLPSHSENFGIVVAEALGTGLPVITTKGTPWAELKTHDCGWWIDIGVEPLTRAILEALALTDEKRLEMGLRGRKMVEQNYSWKMIGEQMVSVYEWVLGHGRLPSCVKEY